jgi:general stress protein CsbA
MIHITCPHCGQEANVPDSHAGLEKTCKCGTKIQVPSERKAATETRKDRFQEANSQGGSLFFLKALLVVIEVLFALLVLAVLVALVMAGHEMSRSALLGYSQGLWIWLIIIFCNAAGYLAYKHLGSGKAGLMVFNGLLLVALSETIFGPLMVIVQTVLRQQLGVDNDLNLQFSIMDVVTITQSVIFLSAIGLLLMGFAAVPQRSMGLTQGSEHVMRSFDSSTVRKKFSLLVLISLGLSTAAILLGVVVNLSVIQFINTAKDYDLQGIYSAIGKFFLYVAFSLLLQLVALLHGRRALAHADISGMRLAGICAVAGGLQHGIIMGIPAIWAGVILIKTANAMSEEVTQC